MNNEKHLGRIILIHGVKARKRNRNRLKRLAPAFQRAGFCVVTPSYGFIPALLVGIFKWIDNRIADNMTAFVQPDDILLGHSNGATLAYLIAKKVKVRGVILLNAALEADLVPNAGWVHVYYNKDDYVVLMSGLIPFHPWGTMGRDGYKGNDLRVTNINQGNPPEPHLPPLSGHSDILGIRKTRPWAEYMAKLAVKFINGETK